MSIIIPLAIPGLFILDLWLSHLIGQWFATLVGGDTELVAGLIGYIAFCVYAVALGLALYETYKKFGVKN